MTPYDFLPVPLAILKERPLFVPLPSVIFASFIVASSVCLIIKLVISINGLHVPEATDSILFIFLNSFLLPGLAQYPALFLAQ